MIRVNASMPIWPSPIFHDGLYGFPIHFTVVDMDCFQPGQANPRIKLSQHVIEMIDNVIPAVKHMACIETYPDVVLQLHLFNDGGDFFKITANFRSLAGHRFQQDRRFLPFEHACVEHVGDKIDTGLCALTDMTARMEIIATVVKIFQTAQIISHGFSSETRVFSVFEQPFSVYGAWASMGAK